MMDKISKIGILGSGQMGSGIAQCAAQNGIEVLLVDQNQTLTEQSKTRISTLLQKQVEKGKLTPVDMKNTLENIQTSGRFADFSQVDFVIEAVPEDQNLKFQIFKQLDEVCPSHALLVTNTSSISITAIAAKTRRPEKVAGMHFMNPVPVMKLVEGIRGLQTSDSTFTTLRFLAEKLGKTFVESKDQPGFVVNRVLMPMINEAIQALYEGISTKEDIDTSMKLGTNHPMGPLTLADFIGLDTCLSILNVLYTGLGDPKYRPSPLLKQYVAAGWLGKKTKRGFYQYESH